MPQDIQVELECIIKFNEEQRGSEKVAEILTKLRTASRDPPPDYKIFKVWVFENFEFTSINMRFFFNSN